MLLKLKISISKDYKKCPSKNFILNSIDKKTKTITKFLNKAMLEVVLLNDIHL